jgi:anaerobic selenocysteine-containing dehydrogenase
MGKTYKTGCVLCPQNCGLADHTSGFEEVKYLFLDFDSRAAVRTCGLDFDQVREVARLFATRKSSVRHDLGIYMNRHSAVCAYLIIMPKAICGRLGVRVG